MAPLNPVKIRELAVTHGTFGAHFVELVRAVVDELILKV